MHFPRYIFKGKNSLGSTHVKQTPHNPDMMWASNTYLIVFQGRCLHSLLSERATVTLLCRTVDMKTMTLIEEEPKVKELA